MPAVPSRRLGQEYKLDLKLGSLQSQSRGGDDK